MTEIHNCPFCGYGQVELDEIEPGRYAINCPDCECIGPFSDASLSHDQAVKSAIGKWNRRIARPDQPIEWQTDPKAAAYRTQ